MVYDLARLSFYKSPQQSLEGVEFKGKPMPLVEKLLQSNKTYKAPRNCRKEGGKIIEHVKRGYVDLVIRSFLNDNSKKDEGKLLAFKIGKPSKLTITSCSDDEFEEIEEEHYPNIKVIWICEQQLISIERNTAIFSKPELVINSLQDHLNKLLLKYGLGVSIAFLSHKTPFWDYVKEYQNRIYEVNFVLFAPNFIGGNLQKTTRDMLKLTKETYNADKLEIGISNDHAKLKVIPEDEQTKNYLSWVREGGGNWYIKVIGDTGKKVTIKSSDNTRSVSVEFDEYSPDSASAIIKLILQELGR